MLLNLQNISFSYKEAVNHKLVYIDGKKRANQCCPVIQEYEKIIHQIGYFYETVASCHSSQQRQLCQL